MSKKTEAFYNKVARIYPAIDVFLKPQKKVLFRAVNELPNGDLLEIGVGNGSHFGLYQRHRVTGIDTSEMMLAVAAKRGYNNIRLMRMSGESLLFNDEQFDYVVLSHVISVVEDPRQLLNQVHRVLKPQGQLFILNHFTPHNWLGYMDKAFGLFSKALHFSAVFKADEIDGIEQFRLINASGLGLASYFKLLIYQKRDT